MSQNQIIADTGFWVALANDKDQYHALAKKAYQLYYKRLITSYFVMTETCHSPFAYFFRRKQHLHIFINQLLIKNDNFQKLHQTFKHYSRVVLFE